MTLTPEQRQVLKALAESEKARLSVCQENYECHLGRPRARKPYLHFSDIDYDEVCRPLIAHGFVKRVQGRKATRFYTISPAGRRALNQQSTTQKQSKINSSMAPTCSPEKDRYAPIGNPLLATTHILTLRPGAELWIDYTLPDPGYFTLVGCVSTYITDEMATEVSSKFGEVIPMG